MDYDQEQQDKEFEKHLHRLSKIQTLQMFSNAAANKQEDQLIPLIIQQNTRLMELLVDLTTKIIMNKH